MEPLDHDIRMVSAELAASRLLRTQDYEGAIYGDDQTYPQFFVSVRRILLVLAILLASITAIFIVLEAPATLLLFFIWGVAVESYDKMVKNQHA